ncbi:hypothetical protein Ab1vBOLIVR2_gp75 [Agrobacterium phage OLIVR2]|uniref:Uncharacterized protein n=1 Tax=Agrobacterium phage OLIVR1 TaxID=2723769 RepID=A0A858MU42_9CAUD|nr:hypothetical protein KNU98_gp034 [Agrobacterium phage OLIVR1]QIW87270.1 hypothetical protein Ab1vBOLIVR1_gp75 [Agrobacterium phage OLIVR1]QIW87378.1 hypothetical protein Ab1vBOLIVR2_gp75 [Agrobacterium phage OLIVR2]QIW87485.1 hypothetical protein Ab1vBOLIVR3_gp75 [Agrobacterium phage OLIVR3]
MLTRRKTGWVSYASILASRGFKSHLNLLPY